MRGYLTNQMSEKREKELYERNVNNQQLDMWRDDNRQYFEKEKEINDRVFMIVY